MKLSPVLSKFLAANKHLSLPGIGTFRSESAYDPEYDGKKAVLLNNITFSQEKVDGYDDELIEFISKETGKMKVLAKSDLVSQLDDAALFMNTGKPYYFAGIGTLAKKPDGNFEFFPEKHTTQTQRKKEKDTPITEKNHVPQEYIDNSTKRNKSLKPAIIIITLSLIAIAATVWFYMKNQEKSMLDETEDVVYVPDSIPPKPSQDSNSITKIDSVTAPLTATPNTYTYIIETVKEPRASKRFNQLKTIGWQVELEVIDSVSKRIVMKLPAAGADTTRIKDSLSALNGKKVLIAQ